MLHHQLAPTKIRASGLYPGPNVIATNIFSASGNRLPKNERTDAGMRARTESVLTRSNPEARTL